MRGCLKQRYKGSWSIILNIGYQIDPTTGRSKRRQKWITFRGTKKEAQTRLNELLIAVHERTYTNVVVDRIPVKLHVL